MYGYQWNVCNYRCPQRHPVFCDGVKVFLGLMKIRLAMYPIQLVNNGSCPPHDADSGSDCCWDKLVSILLFNCIQHMSSKYQDVSNPYWAYLWICHFIATSSGCMWSELVWYLSVVSGLMPGLNPWSVVLCCFYLWRQTKLFARCWLLQQSQHHSHHPPRPSPLSHLGGGGCSYLA